MTQTPTGVGPRTPSTALIHRLREIWHRYGQQQTAQALQQARQLNVIAPAFAEGWHARSFLEMEAGDLATALAAIRQASSLIDPPRPPWQLQELICLEACGLRDQAIELAIELLAADIDHAPFHARLSQILFNLQQFEAAGQANQRALDLQPDRAELHLAQASIDLAMGRIEQAREATQRCLQLEPGHADAIYFRSRLNRQTENDNHVAAIERMLAPPPSDPIAQAKLRYALAKELEDLGALEQSFEHLRQGAASYRSSFRFDVDQEIRFLEAIQAAWSEQVVRDRPDAAALDKTPIPIFVVGLPRTGTTLIERILSAHSQVSTVGELPDFSRLTTRLLEEMPGSSGLDRLDLVGSTVELDFANLGRGYLEQAAPLAGNSRYFIDKFPQNALYLGLIKRALPQARLVLLQRHPLDACYSMYKQMFTDIYHFSYDLEELARYYIAHHRLMRHWQDSLGGSLMSIRYEDVVADQEGTTRSLLKFCGLDWEPQCLDFHRNPAPSTTASASQVREKIYASSVGKWQRLEHQLKPLVERLAEAGCLADWS